MQKQPRSFMIFSGLFVLRRVSELDTKEIEYICFYFLQCSYPLIIQFKQLPYRFDCSSSISTVWFQKDGLLIRENILISSFSYQCSRMWFWLSFAFLQLFCLSSSLSALCVANVLVHLQFVQANIFGKWFTSWFIASQMFVYKLISDVVLE